MALTKPAGCFMQLLSLPFLAGGCAMMATGMMPRPNTGMSPGQVVVGLFLLLAGGVLLWIGRRPAVKGKE